MNSITLNETPSTEDDSSSTAPVPDVLLSLAKDDRYISQITALLGQSVVSLASVLFPRQRRRITDRNNFDSQEIIDDDGRRFIERIQPELYLLASVIVHSATFVFYTRNFGNTSVGNNGGVRRSMGMESLNLAYTSPKNGDSTIKSIGGVSMNPSVGLHGNRMKKLLIRVFNAVSVDRWQLLLFLQTVIQYLIQRAGRGGWSKDLGEILSTALQCLGWHDGTRLDDRASNGVHRGEVAHDDTIRNDDRLRGSQRRRLFEEQRRRMMSAAHSDGTEQEVHDTHDEIEQENNESLTGLGTTNDSRFISKAKSVAKYSWEFLRRVSLAFSSLSHGAHTLARQDVTNNVDTSHFDRYTNMLKWLLRLHLALFYWNGMYPTIYHRLVGVKIRDDVPPFNPHTSLGPNAGNIVANRPTYKPVAVLILLQAATALAQSTAEVSIELIHRIQVAFFRWRRQRNIGINGTTNNPSSAGDNSERQVYLDLVEERVPSVSSSKDESPASTKQRRKQSKSNKNSPTIHPCGICLNERVHPAASVCGHVFCWNCILHWVSNVREECPLCRAPTRPQDVLPLYNYP